MDKTVFEYLVELEDKKSGQTSGSGRSTVDTCDHCCRRRRDTQFVLTLRLLRLASLPRPLRRSDSLPVDLGTVQCLPSQYCHHHRELLRETSGRCDDRE